MSYKVRRKVLGGVSPQPGHYTIQVPTGTQVLTAAIHAPTGQLVLWGIVDDDAVGTEDFTFLVVEDDVDLSIEPSALRHLATSTAGPSGTLHIFESYFNG